MAPPPAPDANNLVVGRETIEADITRASAEPRVEATTRCGDAAAASFEQIVPPPLASGHEVEESAAAETPVPAAPHAGGDAVEALTASPMATSPLKSSILKRPTCRTTTGTSTRACWSGCWASRRSQGRGFRVRCPRGRDLSRSSGVCRCGARARGNCGGTADIRLGWSYRGSQDLGHVRGGRGGPRGTCNRRRVDPGRIFTPAAAVGSTTASALQLLSLQPAAPGNEVVPAASENHLALPEHDVPRSATGSPPWKSKRSGRALARACCQSSRRAARGYPTSPTPRGRLLS